MLASKLSLKAAWLLLLGTTSAVPALDNVYARQETTSADADESGITTSATPVTTTASGTPTLLSSASDKATNTTLTKQPFGSNTTTTTTSAAHPVPTNDKGVSAFAACHNTEGEFRPFCLPKNNEVYYPWSTHYITWDPSFFPHANTTLKVLGFYTSNETAIPESGPPSGEEEAFSSENIDAGWGFYQWHLDKSLLTNPSLSLANITLRIVALPANGEHAQWLTGPTITLRYKPKPPPAPKSHKTETQELWIALPLVFGFAALMIVGTFFWNRQLRQISIGNIMSRSRSKNKKRGFGASKKDRAKNKDKELGIRLMEHGGSTGSDDGEDWEAGWAHESSDRVGRKRM